MVVATAGNDDNSDNSYPARYPNAINLAGVDESNERASISQFNQQVDLSAPRVSML
jgi:serine protease